MGRGSSSQEKGRLSPQEFVSRASGQGPTERLRIGMLTRTIAHDFEKAFTRDLKGVHSLDLSQIFSGLFEHPTPKQRARDERCAIGRVYECMGEPTPEKLQCIVQTSQIPGFEFLRKAVYRILEEGSLVQKKMAARALKAVDPTMESVVRALEQLVDKPQEKVLEPPSRGGGPHKVFLCPNIGGDPHL